MSPTSDENLAWSRDPLTLDPLSVKGRAGWPSSGEARREAKRAAFDEDPRALAGVGGFSASLRRLAHRFRRQWDYHYRVEGTVLAGRYHPEYHRSVDELVAPLTDREANENDQATFESPPYASSAAQVVDFWTAVPIPDYAVNALRSAKPKMHPSIARTVLRCANLAYDALHLPIEEAGVALSVGIEFPDGRVFRPSDAIDYWWPSERFPTGTLPANAYFDR